MADEANEEVVQSSLEKALLAMEDDDSGAGATKTLANTSTTGDSHDEGQGQGREQGVRDEPVEGRRIRATSPTHRPGGGPGGDEKGGGAHNPPPRRPGRGAANPPRGPT